MGCHENNTGTESNEEKHNHKRLAFFELWWPLKAKKERHNMAVNPRTFLTLKALIAIIFCLIGLQYLSLLQVNEKQRRPGQSRTLFSIEREDHSGHFFDSLSEFLHPITDVNELMTSSSLPVKNVKVVSNQSNLEICPMIPPNLHGAV